jgi:hypothetical protein
MTPLFLTAVLAASYVVVNGGPQERAHSAGKERDKGRFLRILQVPIVEAMAPAARRSTGR